MHQLRETWLFATMKRSRQFWYLRAFLLGSVSAILFILAYLTFGWVVYGYFSPHPPPILKNRSLLAVVILYVPFLRPAFILGGVGALASEALVRWTKSWPIGLIMSYVLLPAITFACLFVFADMQHSGNLRGDLKGYWFLTNFFITLYWGFRSFLKWLIQAHNSKAIDSGLLG